MKKALIFIPIVFLFYSCSKDQIDELPDKHNLLETLEIISDSEAENTVNELFTILKSSKGTGGYLASFESEKFKFKIEQTQDFNEELSKILNLFIQTQFTFSDLVRTKSIQYENEIKYKYSQSILNKNQAEYLINYLKILFFTSKQTHNISTFYKNSPNSFLSFSCYLSILSTFGSAAGCVASMGWGCFGVPASVLSTLNNCRRIGSVDPNQPGCGTNADGSPYSCCGINCAPGYVCNSNGDCIPDNNYQGCPNVPCPSDSQCNSRGECVPF